MENFKPDVMERLGLGYTRVRSWNPRIVYASNSGFGAEGEWAMRGSFDAIAQGFTGIATVRGGGPSHGKCAHARWDHRRRRRPLPQEMCTRTGGPQETTANPAIST